MYSYFTDLHVQLLARGILEPGEQLVAQTVTEHSPWWAFGLIRKTYLALATDRRLVMIEHRMAWLHQAMKLHAMESIPWGSVEETKVKGLFTKKLRLRAQTQRGPLRLDMKVPNALFGLLAPMKNNMQGARSIVTTFESARQLGAAPQYGALPPASLIQAHPPINALGYASVPPPSAPLGSTRLSPQRSYPTTPPPIPGHPRPPFHES